MAVSRRAFLRTGTAVGSGLLAGCTGAYLAENPAPRGSRPAPVSILAAGSLAHSLEEGLREATDAPLRIEPRESVAAARLVATGQKDPDIVSLADIGLFKSPVQSEWFAEFATNAIVIAYDASTPVGTQLANAPNAWYEFVLDGTLTLGRTDPDLDPLGYRSLFTLELAATYYGEPALRDRIASRARVYPETQLIGQFETGSIDAAIAYRSMAIERGYDFIDLPARIDLSQPRYVDTWYSTTTYTLPSGTTVHGDLIRYGATIRRPHDAAIDVFRTHVAGDTLRDSGFGVPDNYPRYNGDVPDYVTA